MKPVQDYIYSVSEKSVKTVKSYDFVTFCNFFGVKLPKKLRIVVDFQIRKFTETFVNLYVDRI